MSPDDRPAAPASSAASTPATMAAISFGRRRACLAAHHRRADRPVTDEEGDVRPEPLVGDELEVLPERPPARGQAVRAQRRARRPRVHAAVSGASDVAAVARQLGRVALVEMAGQRAIDQQRAVRMPVRVDEPGRDDPPADLEDGRHLAVRDRRQVADGQDPVAEDADIGRTRPGVRSRRSPSRHGAAGRRSSPRDGDRFDRASDRPTTARPSSRTERSPLVDSAFRGAIAQLEEHLHGMQGVRGSSPRSSTNRDETATSHPSPARRGVSRLRGPT